VITKRIIDVAISSLVLAVLSPLIALLLAYLRVSSGTPLLYKDLRAGHKGEPFTLIKLRTMNFDRDQNGNLLPDEARMTPVGKLLRRFSLDEIPQLWNVLKGDMSLVGPRPLHVRYLERYSSHQARRHEVKPGITGWAQVHGRNSISWNQKFLLDVWYVENRSFAVDLTILIRTVMKVVHGDGISQFGHATMPEFTGDAIDGTADGGNLCLRS
jgi:sugar transferase EpsL